MLGMLSVVEAVAQTTTRPVVKPTATSKSPAPVITPAASNKRSTTTPAQAPAPTTTTPPATTQPNTAPASAPAPQTSAVAEYRLTAVRVKITTGRDNKETPSEVYTKFSLPDQFSSSHCAWARWNQQNEMPVNTEVEVGLSKHANVNLSLPSTRLTLSREEELHTGPKDILLSDIQAHGAQLKIKYYPHLFTDAWRIENVTLILEFKDQNGNLHPVHGRKVLSFSNARTFLNAGNERYLICEVGNDLSAMTSYTGN